VSSIISVLALISLLPAAGVLMMSPMMFDAPGSERNVLLWLFFFSILAHPIAVISGAKIIFKNKVRNMRRYIVGVGVTLAPLTLIVILYFLLSIFCDGNFDCQVSPTTYISQ
jgi:hypothetical protein